MKKAVVFLTALAVCFACMSCKAKGSFKISKTENGKVTYNYAAEFGNDTQTLNTDVDNNTPDELDEMINYNGDGNVLYVNAPSTEDFWWEVVGDLDTTKIDGWNVEDDDYYATCSAIIDDGTGYVIVGRYDDPDKEPTRYAILEVEVKGGKIVSVTDTAVVDSMDEYFD
ncbi:MAG: hypothetical protein IJS09_09425 [Treponema sp.]|nr:hypothetical protein [Treponema sp.]